MNTPNRSAEVAAWVNSHRALFVGDADATTRELLTPLAQHLNSIEGRDVWGILMKTERTPPFVPHDILMWKDTREHFDVFTGPDSGKAEDVQAVWGYNPAPENPAWEWRSVGGSVEPVPVPVPDSDPDPVPSVDLSDVLTLLHDVATNQLALRQTVIALGHQVDTLQEQIQELTAKPDPVLPPITFPRYTGNTKAFGGALVLTPHVETA